MCTVTIIPTDHGVRLACNRDESRNRPIGLPPRSVRVGSRHALMPIDPQAGGTWIAANDAGIVATLLNVYVSPVRPVPRRSRGLIIPSLMGMANLADAYAELGRLAVEDFAPFRLVLADRHGYAEFASTGQAILRTPPTLRQGPMLFTSSGLGDAVVEPPRRALFNEYFMPGENWCERQDAYHRHSWPDRRQVSVCMSRPEARTVSYTIVEIDGTNLAMTYFGEAPDQPVEPVSVHLNLQPTNC